jgi:hypothetical protein
VAGQELSTTLVDGVGVPNPSGAVHVLFRSVREHCDVSRGKISVPDLEALGGALLVDASGGLLSAAGGDAERPGVVWGLRGEESQASGPWSSASIGCPYRVP